MKIQKFLKFGKEAHLKELLQGNIYINHSSFFKKDIQHGIYDKNEGRKSLVNLKESVIQIKEMTSTEWKSINITKGKIQSWNDMTDFHIFSLFQITENETRSMEYFSFSDEIRKMGDHFLIINNPKVFVDKMDSELNNCKYYFERATISYYDQTENQENVSAFHKTSEYEYQKEFRYLIKGNTKQPLRLKIGSLTDIAEIGETNKFKGLRFIWKNNGG
jgi:hypothetical protein